MLLLVLTLLAADYAAPAGSQFAMRKPGGPAILPGGRLVNPEGAQIQTGPGPFGIAVSPDGSTTVTANSGPERFSLTVVKRNGNGTRSVRHLVAPRRARGVPRSDEDDEWRSVFMGLAFHDSKLLWASEGNSGRIRLIDVASGARKRSVDLNTAGFKDSFSGDLALDRQRGLLYVVDQANFRLAVVDTKRAAVVSSIRLGRLPFAVALSPDARRAYVTNLGMFEYQPLPGADPKRPRETGIAFPAFGFPSPESRDGATRATITGTEIKVPALGDPNVRESNSVAVVNVENPAAPRLDGFIRTGLPLGPRSHGGSSPSGVLAAGGFVYVSNAHNDTISVIDAATLSIAAEIPLRVPGLESLRGLLPLGMAFHESTGWLLIAEAGANAVAVIDTKTRRLLGRIPAAWFPTRVLIDRDTVYVANAKGNGTGPNAALDAGETFVGVLRRGMLSTYPLPAASEHTALSARVIANNGWSPLPRPLPAPPAAIRYVVLIVKENRTFDELYGDARAANGRVAGLPSLARFGARGFAAGRGQRLSVHDAAIAPNHRALAERFAFSDNFYADSEVSVDGHHWLAGSYPNAWTESSLMASYAGEKDFRLTAAAPGRLLNAGSNSSVHPEEILEAGAIWHHFERHGIPFRNFGEGFELAGIDEGAGLKPTGAAVLTNVPMPDPLYRNTSRTYPGYNMNIPDQFRATQFIEEITTLTAGGRDLPRFLYIHLPNDHLTAPRPADGYPYEASYMADNDYALGRIVDYLSHSRFWNQMAIFVTEDDAQGGKDHLDSHRTALLAISPYARRNYCSHLNSGFPGLLKTVFGLLGLPPLNLFDAVATPLADVFSTEPDFTPYTVRPVDPRVFVPADAREPLGPRPSPRMDDPRVLREQHRQR